MPTLSKHSTTPITRGITEYQARKQRLKEWLPFAIGAAVFFFLANCIISVITAQVDGLTCIFYLSSGAVFCGATHMVIMGCRKGSWHQ